MKSSLKVLVLSLLFAGFISCGIKESRSLISLKGEWSFKIDSLNIGEKEKWYNKQAFDSDQTVTLPGTTDTNKKGIYNLESNETTHLTREYKYVGKAWYQKKINIPAEWTGKKITLYM